MECLSIMGSSLLKLRGESFTHQQTRIAHQTHEIVALRHPHGLLDGYGAVPVTFHYGTRVSRISLRS